MSILILLSVLFWGVVFYLYWKCHETETHWADYMNKSYEQYLRGLKDE